MNKQNERPDGGRIQPHSPELRERGYELYEKGKSNAEIAAELGIPVSTLAGWSSKGKWKLRKQLASSEVIPSSADEDGAAEEISQLTFQEKQTRYGEIMADHALRVAYTVKKLSPQGLIVNADKIAKLDTIARKALNLEEKKPALVVNVALLARPLSVSPPPLQEAVPGPNLLPGDHGRNNESDP
jgi:transposase-like protein